MSRYVTLRLLETFFRRWWLYLVPLVILIAAGVFTFGRSGPSYRSEGTFYVEGETFLSSLTPAPGSDIGWNTPAGYYNQQLAGLLQTDAFIRVVVEQAELQPGLYLSEQEMLDDVRWSVGSWTGGDNLLRVAASHRDPDISQRLAQSVMEGFVQWQIDSDLSESSAAQAFLGDLMETYEAEVASAQKVLDDYIRANPEPAGTTTRPLAQQVILERLRGEVDLAAGRLNTARVRDEEARLASVQAENVVRQRFRVVDEPYYPLASEPMLRAAIMHVMLFAIMGVSISAAALIALTALDRTVRSAADVRQRLDADLLVVVPQVTA
jgi:uncharacterized protein involved in exopolysaccharide biosynthesis